MFRGLPRHGSERAAAGVRPATGAISAKGTPNTSCSTKAILSAGESVSSTASSAGPTASARSASCSGSPPPGSVAASRAGTRAGGGSPGYPSMGSSRLERRELSASRYTRETTVVSHPLRFSIPPASERTSLSQASWTAASASSVEPSMR